MKHIKLKVRGNGHTFNAAIVDVETDGGEFYEEVQTLERAKGFVQCWNSHDELLAALERIDNIETGCKTRGVGYDIEIHATAKQAIAAAQNDLK